MKLRTLAATAAVAAVGSTLVTLPALAGAGGASVARPTALFVYDPVEFPETASATAHSVSTPSGRTMVRLTVTGLTPGRTYGAHAHTKDCGALGADAGPHWQHDPAAAVPVSPANEIWLDVTPGSSGVGSTKATQDFAFSGAHRPRSVIIHADPTNPVTGGAGARIACLTVGF